MDWYSSEEGNMRGKIKAKCKITGIKTTWKKCETCNLRVIDIKTNTCVNLIIMGTK